MRSQASLAGLVLGAMVVLLAAGTGCSEGRVVAVGPNGDATLFSDFPVGDERRDVARALLTRRVETPVRPELAFKLDTADSTGFRLRREWRNLVLLGDMSSQSWVARQARQLLSRKALGDLVARPAGYAFVANAFADGQTVLLLHATDPQPLAALAAESGSSLIEQFHERIIAGLDETLFVGGEQSALSEGIARRHGYRLRIPAGYFVEEQAENRFVRLKEAQANGAVLFLFVYYQEQTIDSLSAPFCIALRDTLAGIYSASDRVEPARTSARRTRFLGREALELFGLYQNFDPPMGGPFKSICFHDGGRLYMIDLAVFNPPGDKLPQLRVLEAVARTFESRR